MTTLLDQTADFFFKYFCPAVVDSSSAEHNSGSQLGTRHQLQVGRSAERRLHGYVDHNTNQRLLQRLFTNLPEAPHEAPGTIPSPQPALMLPFVDVTHNPNSVLLFSIERYI